MRIFSDPESLAVYLRLESRRLRHRGEKCVRRKLCGMCSSQASTLKKAAQSCEQPDNLLLRPSLFTALSLLHVVFILPVHKRSIGPAQEVRELVEA